MIVEIVVFDTSEPYTSARCAAMSSWVMPRAEKAMTMSSIDPNWRCRFATIVGSNVPARSLGTPMVTGPTFVSTVFVRVPLRALPSAEAPLVCLS